MRYKTKTPSFSLFTIVTALLLICISAGPGLSPTLAQQADNDPADTNNPDTSRELFRQIFQVLSHPRCTNCHSVEELPRAGDAQYSHLPQVPRGNNGFGDQTLPCSTCHNYRNSPVAPGAVSWQAAPLSMGWYGLSAGELCRRLTDRSRNGDRTLADIDRHMRTSPTVLWAWEPGGILSPPPLSHGEFRQLFSDWVASGGICPP